MICSSSARNAASIIGEDLGNRLSGPLDNDRVDIAKGNAERLASMAPTVLLPEPGAPTSTTEPSSSSAFRCGWMLMAGAAPEVPDPLVASDSSRSFASFLPPSRRRISPTPRWPARGRPSPQRPRPPPVRRTRPNADDGRLRPRPSPRRRYAELGNGRNRLHRRTNPQHLTGAHTSSVPPDGVTPGQSLFTRHDLIVGSAASAAS